MNKLFEHNVSRGGRQSRLTICCVTVLSYCAVILCCVQVKQGLATHLGIKLTDAELAIMVQRLGGQGSSVVKRDDFVQVNIAALINHHHQHQFDQQQSYYHHQQQSYQQQSYHHYQQQLSSSSNPINLCVKHRGAVLQPLVALISPITSIVSRVVTESSRHQRQTSERVAGAGVAVRALSAEVWVEGICFGVR